MVEGQIALINSGVKPGSLELLGAERTREEAPEVFSGLQINDGNALNRCSAEDHGFLQKSFSSS
jgi:hypothetical protein